jgi:urease accessory protein
MSPTRPPVRHQRADGIGRIAFSRTEGATVLDQLYQEGAAKIRLPQAAGRVEAILINTAGGLTGGDRLSWRIDAGPGARAAVTTQACEKVYRSIDGRPAVIETRISVGDKGRLDWLPQETILFDRSALSRTLDVRLAADSTFLAVEAVVFGRQAMGEDVRRAFFHDRWRIARAGRLIFADDLRFDGAVSALLARPAIAAGARACATILLVAPDAERYLEPLRGQEAGVAASAFDGKLLARLIAGDAYSLRKSLVPALELLSGGQGLPKAWAL